MTNPITEIIAQKGWALADGATGTNYFKRGLETGHPPELWNIEQPEDVIAVHAEFIAAGADIILTNSFGGTSYRLKLHKADDRVEELNLAAVKLARVAVNKAGRKILVAGTMGPTGELFNPLGALEADTAIAAFTEQAEALAAGGADLIWIETMSSVAEVEAAIVAAKRTGLPICATMTFDTAGRSMMGVMPADFATMAISSGVTGYGANCGIGPAELLDSVMQFQGGQGGQHESPFIIAKGNCGIPAYLDGEIHYHGSPELMAEYAVFARDAGAQIIGGCCGTTPVHLKAMYDKLISTPPQPLDLDRVRSVLGAAWKDVPVRPEGATNAGARGSRRRRKRD